MMQNIIRGSPASLFSANHSLSLLFVLTNVGAANSRPNYRHDNSVGFIENICKIETFRAANSRPYSESVSMEQLDKREFVKESNCRKEIRSLGQLLSIYAIAL